MQLGEPRVYRVGESRVTVPLQVELTALVNLISEPNTSQRLASENEDVEEDPSIEVLKVYTETDDEDFEDFEETDEDENDNNARRRKYKF